MNPSHPGPKPQWLRRRIPAGKAGDATLNLLSKAGLHTVCQEAQCPNIHECFACRTATFMILGDRCTRACRFCAVRHEPTQMPDPDEPRRVAEAAAELGLRYVVVTSVTRDDLPDGGADQFGRTIQAIHEAIPESRVEVLIPDFQGEKAPLHAVLDVGPDVLNHNLETVERLYEAARPQAVYRRSLDLLKEAGRYAPAIPTKSGLMLGLGEKEEEVEQTLKDLREAGCQMLTLGQYLQPAENNLPVARYVPPEEFDHWAKRATELGFSHVASAPFVRSSYHAGEHFAQREAARPIHE